MFIYSAEQHPQPREPSDLDEFDPLASTHHHNLPVVPEQKQADFGFDDQPIHQHVGFDEGLIASKPKHDDDTGHKEPETPVDNANEEIITRSHHAPLTENEPSHENKPGYFDQHDYNEIGMVFERRLYLFSKYVLLIQRILFSIF